MSRKKIERTREILVYENEYLFLYDDEVEFPGNSPGRYLRLNWKCEYSVGVLPITDDNEVILVKQFCYASQCETIQIPKGMGIPGVDPHEVAARELSEEIGATAGSLDHLVTFNVDPSLIQNEFHIFVARSTSIDHASRPEISEVVFEPVLVPLNEFESPDIIHRVNDPVTLAAASLFRAGQAGNH